MKQIPQYLVVYETLRKHIEKGLYNEGDILPSEHDLCAVHHVTRPTVRKALDMLANEGFIKKRQGLGSLVQKKPKGIGILSIGGTTTAVGEKNLITKVLVKPEVRPWPAKFLFPLTEIELESGCIYFERLRFLDNNPIFHDISYIPNINLPRFTSRNLENKSLLSILRKQYQVKVIGGEQYLKATNADETTRMHLKVDSSAPILSLERKMETNRDGFHLYSFLSCNTEAHILYGSF